MNKSHKSALIITGFYALFAGCWILFSDLGVSMLVSDASAITWLQTAKGWFFVAVTALLLYLAVSSLTAKVEQAYKLDGMTGLLSHELFKLQLSKLVSIRKPEEKIIIGILDINNFKEINARYGFDTADQLVIGLADAISQYALPNSLICRLPPDQFMMARNYSQQVDQDLRVTGYIELFERVACSLNIEANCSIGVAFCPADGNSAKSLMDAAVEALRTAKISGNTIQYHNKTLTERARAKRKMVDALKQALAEDSLSLVYQPKYEVASNSVSGVEVLIRWHHPVHGFISPAEFIPLAEEYDLTSEISQFVLRRATCELLAAGLLGTTLKHVAVNVSAAEFNDPQQMEALLATIKQHPKLAPFLRIEITETATLTDIKQSSAIITQLRNQGLSISIDDFGTGYTSLAMLKDLIIDEIKIDRSFVDGLGEDNRSTTIVGAIIGMAKSFDINVIAEGVETEDQLQHLTALQCDEVQGYLLGAPMRIDALVEHLSQPKTDLTSASSEQT